MANIELKPYPMMDKPEIEALCAVLEERKPTRVLEWGAGGSTLYWPKLFPDIKWLSVEHNPDYFQALKGKTTVNVTLLQLDYPAYHELKAEDVGTFDLIIVDGRHRVRCLDVARELLNTGGAAILHDSGRERYAPARNYYHSITVLHPPKKAKDPRGLWLLTEPIPRPKPKSRGVIYMCWGDPAIREAEASMRSLWKHEPGMPVLVVGDDQAVKHFADHKLVATHTCCVDPFTSSTLFGFKAGRVKPLLAGISPFEQTLYVDAETEFKISPAIGFDLLEKWDFVIAEAETRSLAATFQDNRTEASKTAAWLKTPHILYHNSGMMFWKTNEATKRLFELWSEEWQKYKGWDEQIALLRALLRSEVLFLNVPYTWNCRGPQGAYMLYHRFASRAARKHIGSAIIVHGRRGVPMVPILPLVQVELEPGRFVKCHKGDEERVRATFKQYRRVK
jgi:hypothetical protein